MTTSEATPNKPNPDDFIITRKRKLYKFAAFSNMPNCYNETEWIAKRSSLLDNQRQITLEIGAGSALFSTKLAALFPERLFIAVDRKSDRLYAGAKLAVEQRLANIYYIWTNADNLTRLFPTESIGKIWITFPDPWPQDSNIKHRLTNAKRLNQYVQLLKPTGKLAFKTDNKALFDWSLTQLNKNWQIEFLTSNLHATSQSQIGIEPTTTTSYEERYVAEGKQINYLLASKQ